MSDSSIVMICLTELFGTGSRGRSISREGSGTRESWQNGQMSIISLVAPKSGRIATSSVCMSPIHGTKQCRTFESAMEIGFTALQTFNIALGVTDVIAQQARARARTASGIG